MSTEANIESSSTAQSDTRVSKQTLLTVYARDEDMSARDFIGAIVNDHISKDPWSKSEVERRDTSVSFEIEVDAPSSHYDDTITISASDSVFSTEADMVKAAIGSGDLELGDHLEFEDEVTTSVEHDHSTTSLVKSFAKSVFSDFTSPVEGYVDSGSFGALQYEKVGVNADGEEEKMYAELKGPYGSHISAQNVLKMQPDRTAEERFETDENGTPVERQAVQFDFEVEGDNANEVDQMTEAFITTIRDVVAKEPSVGRVRLTNCQKTVTETGDCHNL